MRSSADEKPGGSAWRVYDRPGPAGRRFRGVAVELGSDSAEVVFRWAGCSGRLRMPVEEWRRLEKEPADGFQIRVHPDRA